MSPTWSHVQNSLWSSRRSSPSFGSTGYFLGGHPLYPAGLKSYAFNEVIGSPYLRELGTRNAKTFPGTQEHYTKRRHWIVAFHDETLEVVGDSVTYLGTEDAPCGREAISRHTA